MFVAMKILVSAIAIGIVSEIARKFPVYGGIIAALPLVSLLSIFWLYLQGEENTTLGKFALGVLWGFPATAVLLLVLYLSLKQSLPLVVSFGLGVAGWGLFLLIQDIVIKNWNAF